MAQENVEVMRRSYQAFNENALAGASEFWDSEIVWHTDGHLDGRGGTIEGMSESNVDLARRGYEAALAGDLDVIAGLLDPDVSWHGGDPTAPGACHNRHEAVEFMRQARARGGVGELVDVIDAGDRVVVIMRPPSRDGEPAALGANLSTFRDGKVIEMVHYSNPDDALAAAQT